jgi:5-methylcytosine-specific restriction endonuclease McrA
LARRRGDFIGGRAWQELRRQRLVFAHWQCECCGATWELQLDHIDARANIGDRRRLTLHEVQILCRRCNQLKGTSSLTAAELREVHRVELRDPMRDPMRGSIFAPRRPKPRVG